PALEASALFSLLFPGELAVVLRGRSWHALPALRRRQCAGRAAVGRRGAAGRLPARPHDPLDRPLPAPGDRRGGGRVVPASSGAGGAGQTAQQRGTPEGRAVVIRASTARSHPSERPQLPPREARASHPSDTPTPAIVRSFVVWMLASQRPLWRLAKQRGLLRTAPVAIAFLATCLAVSGSWATSGLGHRLVADCCAYRGWHPGLGPSVRLAGSAFLLRHQYEVIWTIVA